MSTEFAKPTKYPLLETVLAYMGLPMKGKFTVKDIADVFGVTTRTIQTRIKRGGLTSRDLPGHSKFLAMDLEQYLHNSSTPPSIAA